MPGELVLKRSAVDVIGRETLDRMNTMGVMAKAPPGGTGPVRQLGASRDHGPWVDRDQVPGRNAIVHMIGDDLQRGGSIRQLIKRVAVGG